MLYASLDCFRLSFVTIFRRDELTGLTIIPISFWILVHVQVLSKYAGLSFNHIPIYSFTRQTWNCQSTTFRFLGVDLKSYLWMYLSSQWLLTGQTLQLLSLKFVDEPGKSMTSLINYYFLNLWVYLESQWLSSPQIRMYYTRMYGKALTNTRILTLSWF